MGRECPHHPATAPEKRLRTLTTRTRLSPIETIPVHRKWQHLRHFLHRMKATSPHLKAQMQAWGFSMHLQPRAHLPLDFGWYRGSQELWNQWSRLLPQVPHLAFKIPEIEFWSPEKWVSFHVYLAPNGFGYDFCDFMHMQPPERLVGAAVKDVPALLSEGVIMENRTLWVFSIPSGVSPVSPLPSLRRLSQLLSS